MSLSDMMIGTCLMQEFRCALGLGADDTQLAAAVMSAHRIAVLVYTRVRGVHNSESLEFIECHGSVYSHLVSRPLRCMLSVQATEGAFWMLATGCLPHLACCLP